MTVSRIDECFARCRAQGRSALIGYLTIGDPSVQDSLACARAAIDTGADMLELGVPFSDPTADGPTIAAASQRAIAAGGSLRAALSVASELREHSDAPLVLFTYMNPVITFGEEALPEAAARAGVDALLLVDLPPEEGALLRQQAQRHELAVIPLIAPTTSTERAQRLMSSAQGFAYQVSMTGVTGSAEAPLAAAAQSAIALSSAHGVPVAVGFGVDSPEKAALLARAGVDAVVVGSAIVRAIANGNDTAGRCQRVRSLVSSLAAAMGQ